ncbi:MAG: hypothetical protein J0665_16395 [Deltaproteobacteria bacterium]|nr:hypothetical protein [Deltaproteobacteria bacterium]
MSDLESLVTSAYKIAITKLQTEKNDYNILICNDFICNEFVISAIYKSITKLQTGGRSYVY